MDKPKFVGHVVSGGPVTTQKAREAGLIKNSPEGYSVEFSYHIVKEPEDEFREMVRDPQGEIKDMIGKFGHSFVKHRISDIISEGRPYFRQVNLDEGVLNDCQNLKINGSVSKLLNDLYEDWRKRAAELGAGGYTREDIELKVVLIMKW